MKSPRISIVIPTYNKVEQLAFTVRLLLRQTLSLSEYEIVISDNNSKDSTAEYVNKLAVEHPNVRYVLARQQGRSPARNAGIAAAHGEIVMLMDDDIVVTPDHLEQHLRLHDQHPNSIVMGFIIDCSQLSPRFLETYYHNRQLTGSGRVGKGEVEIDYRYTDTANMSLPYCLLDAIKQTGTDGEPIYLTVMPRREDTLLGYRLLHAGAKFVFSRDVLCYHYHPRGWRTLWNDTYMNGRALYVLEQYIPNVSENDRYLFRSRLQCYALATLAMLTMFAGYLLRPISPWLLQKSIGAILSVADSLGFLDEERCHEGSQER